MTGQSSHGIPPEKAGGTKHSCYFVVHSNPRDFRSLSLNLHRRAAHLRSSNIAPSFKCHIACSWGGTRGRTCPLLHNALRRAAKTLSTEGSRRPSGLKPRNSSSNSALVLIIGTADGSEAEIAGVVRKLVAPSRNASS
jgi:hypothetical protein